MVVGDGFEPSKLSRRIYNPIPLATRESHQYLLLKWCRHQESNSGPTDYKSVALPTELYRLSNEVGRILLIRFQRCNPFAGFFFKLSARPLCRDHFDQFLIKFKPL
jgi:hypothetical protein